MLESQKKKAEQIEALLDEGYSSAEARAAVRSPHPFKPAFKGGKRKGRDEKTSPPSRK